MLGQLTLSATYRGESFLSTSRDRSVVSLFVLCSGQQLSRDSVPDFSAIWPSGAFGSDDTNVKLPDLSNGEYLRGADLGRNLDGNPTTRTAKVGPYPASGVGSFQASALGGHTHPSGDQAGQTTQSNSTGSISTEPTVTATSGPAVITGSPEGGNIALGTDFEPRSFLAWPYIVVSGSFL